MSAFPDIVIGFSSHDSGIAMPLLGYALGSRMVEKHFTLDRTMRGTDHAFSLEPVGMRKLVRDLKRARIAMGDGVKKQYASEEKPLFKMAKKLVAARDLPAGHVLSRDDIAIKSPNDGLGPISPVRGDRPETHCGARRRRQHPGRNARPCVIRCSIFSGASSW